MDTTAVRPRGVDGHANRRASVNDAEALVLATVHVLAIFGGVSRAEAADEAREASHAFVTTGDAEVESVADGVNGNHHRFGSRAGPSVGRVGDCSVLHE